MKKFSRMTLIFLIALSLAVGSMTGCNPKQEEQVPEQAEETASEPKSTDELLAEAQPAPPEMKDIVAMVDGAKLTKTMLEKDLKAKMEVLKAQIPNDKMDEVRQEVRMKIIENFIMRTLFANEVDRLKISASDKEVTEAIDKLKASLPSDVTYDAFLKKNNLTREQAKEEIRLGVRIEKYVQNSVPQDPKVTEKEINDFYKENKDKFVMPETVHARHILVKTNAEDDAKAQDEKKQKAESIRNELLAGADFAEVAAKHSDCPSSQAGGDLGEFVRGQMVKPFDDAAFSQKEKEIGPVVKTEYGYHIIQVMKREKQRTMPLNEEIKSRITAYLKMKKQEQAYDSLMKKMRDKAHIVVYSS